MKNSKTYLVTGGAGFIGSHLCDGLLAKGHKVIVLDNLETGKKANLAKEVEFVLGDINDTPLVKKLMCRVEGCFHLAAITSVVLCNQDKKKSHTTNLMGSINIFEAALGRDKKPLPVVYASSSAIYGSNKNTPFSESAAPEPLSIYAADKLGTESQAYAAANAYKLPSVGLRLFNIYGPRQDPHNHYSGVISIFLEHLLNNEPIHIYGNGLQSRDFVYVTDSVQFFIASMEKLEKLKQPKGFIYNVCTGKTTTIKQLEKLMEGLLNKKRSTKIIYDETRVGDVRRSLGNPNKAWRELKVKTQYSLQEGLAKYFKTLKV